MKNTKKAIWISLFLAAGLLPGCVSAPAKKTRVQEEKQPKTVEQTDETQKVKEEEPKILELGEQGQETAKLTFENQTGKGIVSFAWAKTGEEDYEQLMPADGQVQPETVFVWYAPKAKEEETMSGFLLAGGYDLQIRLEDGTELEIHDLIPDTLQNVSKLKICMEDQLGYLEYEDEDGKVISTLETEQSRQSSDSSEQAPAQQVSPALETVDEEYTPQPAYETETSSWEPVYEEPAYQPVYTEPAPVVETPAAPVIEVPAVDSSSSEGCLGLS